MKVSIIIPFWNIGGYVDRCLESVTGQTHTDIEIIAVDNASGDDTAENLRKWVEKDSRIKIITMDENGGPSGARNAGLDAATGEYICFVDGDDCVTPHYAESLLSLAQENDCRIAMCAYALNDSVTSPRDIPMTLQENPCEVLGQYDYFQRIYTDKRILYVVIWNKIYHKSVFENLRFADMLNEDDAIIHSIIDRAERIAVKYDTLYFYTVRDGSVMRSAFSPEYMKILPAYQDRIDYFAEKGWNDLAFLTMKVYMVKCLELYNDITAGTPDGKEYRKILAELLREMLKQAEKCPVKSRRFLMKMAGYAIRPERKNEDWNKVLYGI